MNFVVGLLNSVPVVGHAKALLHYGYGDSASGNEAMYSSSRTALVIGGGIVGAAGGLLGATMGAMSAGAVLDGVVTLADSSYNQEFRPHGGFEAIGDIVKGDLIKGVAKGTLTGVVDGLGGVGVADGIVGIGMMTSAGRHILGRSIQKQVAKEVMKSAAIDGVIDLVVTRDHGFHASTVRMVVEDEQCDLVNEQVTVLSDLLAVANVDSAPLSIDYICDEHDCSFNSSTIDDIIDHMLVAHRQLRTPDNVSMVTYFRTHQSYRVDDIEYAYVAVVNHAVGCVEAACPVRQPHYHTRPAIEVAGEIVVENGRDVFGEVFEYGRPVKLVSQPQ